MTALLCESCGYNLTGLDPEGVCPECARPLAANTRHRPGSPWQQAPSFEAWVMTTAAVLRRPASVWSEIELEFPRSWSLLICNLVIASIVTGAGIMMGADYGGAGAAGALLGGFLFAIPLFIPIFLLAMLCNAAVRALTGAGSLAVRSAVAHAAFCFVLLAPAAFFAAREPTLTILLAIGPATVIWLGAIGARRLRYAPEPGAPAP